MLLQTCVHLDRTFGDYGWLKLCSEAYGSSYCAWARTSKGKLLKTDCSLASSKAFGNTTANTASAAALRRQRRSPRHRKQLLTLPPAVEVVGIDERIPGRFISKYFPPIMTSRAIPILFRVLLAAFLFRGGCTYGSFDTIFGERSEYKINETQSDVHDVILGARKLSESILYQRADQKMSRSTIITIFEAHQQSAGTIFAGRRAIWITSGLARGRSSISNCVTNLDLGRNMVSTRSSSIKTRRLRFR